MSDLPSTADSIQSIEGVEEHPLFELQTDTSRQNASVPISWCTNQELADAIVQRRKSYPELEFFVLLSIVSGEKEVERIIVPIDQVVQYVALRSAGENRVFGAVLSEVPGDRQTALQEIRTKYLSKDEGLYKTTLLNDGLTGFCLEITGGSSLLSTATDAITVVVGDEYFAKEPPAWLKKWATLLWSSPLRDECSFRRRVIFSFTLQPLLLPLLLLCCEFISICGAILCLFFGMRGINWQPILHPMQYSPSDVWQNTEESMFTPKANIGDETKEVLNLLPFMPVSLLFFAFCALIFQSRGEHVSFSWLEFAFVTSGLAVAATVIIFLLEAMYLGWRQMFVVQALGMETFLTNVIEATPTRFRWMTPPVEAVRERFKGWETANMEQVLDELSEAERNRKKDAADRVLAADQELSELWFAETVSLPQHLARLASIGVTEWHTRRSSPGSAHRSHCNLRNMEAFQ